MTPPSPAPGLDGSPAPQLAGSPGAVPLDDDTVPRRWARRLKTIPAVHLGLALLVLLLPLLLPAALIRDALSPTRRRLLPTTRGLLICPWYLLCEVLGLQGALWTWVLTGGGLWAEGLRRSNLALQRRWVQALFAGVRGIFGVKIEMSGLDGILAADRSRPFLLFLRHSSLPDVLLPGLAFANPRRIELHYVLKVEVCASPCLDVVGHRLSNAFVRRGSDDPAREIRRILRLQTEVRPGEGLVIYPEGTRFSKRKRDRLLARMEEKGDTTGVARVQRFRHVLPPRPGGPLALLAARRSDEDVIFVAHVGTEAAMNARRLAEGELVGATFRVHAWRVPAEEVPRGEAAAAWLDDWWERVDDWVGANAPEG